MRKNELVNLRWGHRDLDNGVAQVITTEKFTTKSGRNRTVPICEDLAELLRSHQRPAGYVVNDRIQGYKGKRRPDILIQGPDGQPRLIIDTKWKIWDPAGPSSADLYQLHAYAAHWGCPDNVLLMPAQAGAASETYSLTNDPSTCIHAAFVAVDAPEEVALQQLASICAPRPVADHQA